ncbi:MAG: hypothetical protein DSZ06_01455, partial [Sulfurospirillum sp.]
MAENYNNIDQLDNYHIDEDEIDLRELFLTIKNNYLYIVVTTIVFVLFASIYTYLKPVSYESFAIIDMQTKKKQSIQVPDILSGFSSISGLASDDVDKVLTYSKTFSINKKILEIVDFEVQYFKKDQFKKVELYQNSPILIKNLKFKDKKSLAYRYIFTPIDAKSFNLKVTTSNLLKTTVIEKRFNYDQNISLNGISFVVVREKSIDFKEACEVKF